MKGTNIKETMVVEYFRRGNEKGGNSFFLHNSSLKDKQGKFIGSVVDSSKENKDVQKTKDILIIAKAFLEYPTYTLEELEQYLSEYHYSKDYIYDCLTSNKTRKIVGEQVSDKIVTLLKQNQSSFLRKLLAANIELESQIDNGVLTDIERQVFELRKQGLSQEAIAKELGVSHTTIMEYENRLIEKLQSASRKYTK